MLSKQYKLVMTWYILHRYQRESITNISNEKFNQSLMNIACHHEFRANQFDLRRSNSRLIFWPPIGHGGQLIGRRDRLHDETFIVYRLDAKYAVSSAETN